MSHFFNCQFYFSTKALISPPKLQPFFMIPCRYIANLWWYATFLSCYIHGNCT